MRFIVYSRVPKTSVNRTPKDRLQAFDLVQERPDHEPLPPITELPAVGPYLNKQILNWLEHPPDLDWAIPEIRRNFLTIAETKAMRSREQERFAGIRGDLQMQTTWSDGSGSIQDMAEAAVALG